MLDDPRMWDRLVVKIDSHIWDEWSAQRGAHVCARADELPFRQDCFDLVGSFDVLEHLREDRQAVSEQARVSCDQASIVASVPADPNLWSAHDVAVGHQRRYTVGALEALLDKEGLYVDDRTHFFTFLWLPARLMRSRRANTEEPASGDNAVAKASRLAIRLLCSAERYIARRISLPFGTSLWVEARRPPGAAAATLPE
jgi:SAM-dependent methyltransferase